MSEENVKIVRASIDAYNRRDFEAMQGLNQPDVELDWSRSVGLGAQVYHGWEEVMSFYADFFGTFEEIKLEPERVVAGGDSVVVPNTAYLRGRDGVETVARSAFVFELRGGLISRICLFQGTDEAFDAAGLSE